MIDYFKISYRNFIKLAAYLNSKNLTEEDCVKIQHILECIPKEQVKFVEKFAMLKQNCGENLCEFEDKHINLNEEFIRENIVYEDIMFADFTDEFKMQLARVLKRSQSFEKYIYQVLKENFPNDKITSQYYMGGFRVDYYFNDYNIAVEADEIDHKGRIWHDEMKEDYLKEKFQCSIVRIKEYRGEKTISEFVEEISIAKENASIQLQK